jgi:hypothetical protein
VRVRISIVTRSFGCRLGSTGHGEGAVVSPRRRARTTLCDRLMQRVKVILERFPSRCSDSSPPPRLRGGVRGGARPLP